MADVIVFVEGGYEKKIYLHVIPRIGEVIWIDDDEKDQIEEMEVKRIIHDLTNHVIHICCEVHGGADDSFLLSHGFSKV